LQQKVNLLGSKDLLIGISFGRCLQDTVDAVIGAHKRKVPTFGLSDSDTSPIARFSDSFWVTSIANPSFHGSYVAPLAAINALLVACAHLHPQRSLEVLRNKEQELRSGTRWYSENGATESRSKFKENGHEHAETSE
jgi:DNA-binding MurR/RpiR family transcriptional regulator